MDGTRADHHGKAVIHAVQNAVQGLARRINGVRHRLAAWKLAHYMRRRRQFLDFSDTQVIGIVGHGELLPGIGARLAA
jgi:hypothetical protein